MDAGPVLVREPAFVSHVWIPRTGDTYDTWSPRRLAEEKSQPDAVNRLKSPRPTAEASCMKNSTSQVCTGPRPEADAVVVIQSEGGAAVSRPGAPEEGAPLGSAELADVTAAKRVGRADATVEEAVLPSDDPVATNLEIEGGDITLFEAAIGAFHADDFQRAESLFLEEAQRNDVAPQRAAIAYRQAALAARQSGRVDASDHWMRLAGREYLRVTEDDRTPLPFVREAAVMAAKCFLSVENLHVASKGLRRAQAIESVLSADEDLMAQGDKVPFAAPATSPSMLEVVAEDVSQARLGSGQSSPAPSIEQAPDGNQPLGTGAGAAVGRFGWLRRINHHRALRKMA